MDAAIRDVGRRLRALRRARSVTLEQLAADSGFTVGYLSQIETGAAVPTLSALASLASALGSDVGAFFPFDQVERVRISRVGSRDTIRVAGGTAEHAVLSARGSSAAFSALLTRHTTGSAPASQRLFGERLAYVRRGRAQMTIGGERHEMGPGESIHYSSHPEHSGAPMAGEEAEVLWLVSPPIV